MARCPNCKRHFREPPDEQGDHDCPHCGWQREWGEPGREDEGENDE